MQFISVEGIEERLEDTLENKDLGLIPTEELLLYLSRITARITSVENQAKTLDSVIDALIDNGAEYTDQHIQEFNEYLEGLDRSLEVLYTSHRAIATRALDEI